MHRGHTASKLHTTPIVVSTQCTCMPVIQYGSIVLGFIQTIGGICILCRHCLMLQILILRDLVIPMEVQFIMYQALTELLFRLDTYARQTPQTNEVHKSRLWHSARLRSPNIVVFLVDPRKYDMWLTTTLKQGKNIVVRALR